MTSTSGVPVATGNLNIWIKVYDAASAGTCLYAMRGSCGTPSYKTVTVTNGVFSMLIGDVNGGDNEIPESLFDNNTLFLGVTVASDTEMVPRKRITAAPYALNSDKLDDLDATSSGSTTPYIVATTTNGNLTITGDPQGASVGSGSIYINPAAASANETILGVASNGSTLFRIDKEGDITSTGSLLATAASSTAQFIFRGAALASMNIFEVQDSFTNRLLSVSATSTLIDLDNVSGYKVGIGTTAPIAKLNIGGTLLLQDSTEVGQAGRGLLLTPGVFSIGQTITGYGSNGVNALALQGFNTSSGPPAVTSEIDLNASGYIIFKTATSLGGATSEKARLTSGGSFGIGNSAPANMLTVGSATSTFEVNSAGNLVKVNNVPYSWPSTQGGASTVLTNNGSGVLTWEAAGGGLTLQGAYDNDANGGDVIITTNSTDGALTIAGDQAFNVTTSGATTISNAFLVNGNTTLGDASGDTLTSNFGQWNFANNLLANMSTYSWTYQTDVSAGAAVSILANNLVTADGFAVSSSSARNVNSALISLADSGAADIDSTIFSITSSNASALSTAISVDLDNGNNDNIVFSLVTDETTVSGTAADTEKFAILASGSARGDGNLTFGSASGTNTVNFSGARIASNLTPTVDATYSLGDPALRWKDLWLSGGSANIAYDTSGTSVMRLGFETTHGLRGVIATPSNIPLQIRVGLPSADNVGLTLNTSGQILIPDGSGTSNSLAFASDPTFGFYKAGAGVGIVAGGNLAGNFTSTGVTVVGLGIQNSTNSQVGGFAMTTGAISWGPNPTMDVGLSRIGVGIVAVGNGSGQSTSGTLVAFKLSAGSNTAPANALTVGSATSTFEVNSAGNLVKVNNVAYSWPASQGGASTVLTNDGSGNLTWASGGSPTLQAAYTASTGGATPEITLDATRGALTLADTASPLGTNLFEIQDTSGGGGYTKRYFTVSSTTTSIDGQFLVFNSTNAIDAASFTVQADSLTNGHAQRIKSSAARTGSGSLLHLSDTGATGGGTTMLNITSSNAAADSDALVRIDADHGNNDRVLFYVASDETSVSGTTADTDKFVIYSSGSIQSDGNLTFGSASTTNTINFSGARISSNLTPTTDNTYSLGDPALRWKDLWLSGGSANIAHDTSGTSVMKVGIETTTGLRGVIATPSNMGLQLKTTRGSSDTNGIYINTSGNVGIGTVTPDTTKLVVSTATTGDVMNVTTTGGGIYMAFSDSGGTSGYIGGPDSGLLSPSGANSLQIMGGSGGVLLGTDDTAYFAVTPGGAVGIGSSSGFGTLTVISGTTAAASFNRESNDGTVINIMQAGNIEGAINVSGTTVSYTGFTGSHYAWTDQAIERGLLVSLTGENRHFHGDTNSEIIYGIAPSATANDSRILGSYLALQEPSKPADDENPHMVMAVGNGDMWVVENGTGNVGIGDFLISSDMTGHAMKDPGTYAVSHVVARATEDIDWSTVTDTIGGKKRKKIIVTFELFDKNNGGSVSKESTFTLNDDGMKMPPPAYASALQTAIASRELSFIGSAWDSASSTSRTRSISMLNEVTNPDTYQIVFKNNDGFNLAILNQTGDLSIAGNFSTNAIRSPNGLWSITPEGYVLAQKVETKTLKTESVIVVQSETHSAVAEGKISAGSAAVVVRNPEMKQNSKVFVTFLDNPRGGYWITAKSDGSFKIHIGQPAVKDVPFEYWIVGVEDQRPVTPAAR